ELGTPLTVALGNLQIAVRYLDSADMDRIRPLVAESKDALDSLAFLTSQIVAASRGDELALTVEPTDLLAPLQKARSWATKNAADKGLKLELPSDLKPLFVMGDEEALHSIVNNLLSNAIRYTPQGGQISVAYGQEEGRGWLSVSDTGIGMSREEQ